MSGKFSISKEEEEKMLAWLGPLEPQHSDEEYNAYVESIALDNPWPLTPDETAYDKEMRRECARRARMQRTAQQARAPE